MVGDAIIYLEAISIRIIWHNKKYKTSELALAFILVNRNFLINYFCCRKPEPNSVSSGIALIVDNKIVICCANWTVNI